MLQTRLAALLATAVTLSLSACSASAVVSGALIGKGVATAMDRRSLDEVKTDTEIDAALTAKFAAQDGDDFKSVSALVFAGRVVLVGFAATPEIRRRAETLARSETRYQHFKNAVLIGSPDRNAAADLALDAKINAVLTTTPGVESINMRWKVWAGHVFLMGLAKTHDEAELAARTIRGLEGVKAVHSALDVGKT